MAFLINALMCIFFSKVKLIHYDCLPILMLLYIIYTLNINQSNVSTKLKKNDFVIPEIEVTSQLIDLRSSATLC